MKKVEVTLTYRCGNKNKGEEVARVLRDRIIERVFKDSYEPTLTSHHKVLIEVVSAGAPAGETMSLDVAVQYHDTPIPRSHILANQRELANALKELFCEFPGMYITVSTAFNIMPTAVTTAEVPERQPA